jgi:uncharacterized protein (TIGR00725 family)
VSCGRIKEFSMSPTVTRKPVIVGVMGGHHADPGTIEEARRLGEVVAKKGYVLLTGGGGGVMKAASAGAWNAGGLVIALLPNERRRPLKDYPNEYVDIPIYTGMGDGRNAINAKTPHVVVALRGGAGTLSEIALALKSGTPVIGLHARRFDVPEECEFYSAGTVEEVMEQIEKILSRTGR